MVPPVLTPVYISKSARACQEVTIRKLTELNEKPSLITSMFEFEAHYLHQFDDDPPNQLRIGLIALWMQQSSS
jgi:hypothetical protein